MAQNQLSRLSSSLHRFLTKAGRGLWYGYTKRQQPKDFQAALTLAMNRQIRQIVSIFNVNRLLAEVHKATTVSSRIKGVLKGNFYPLTSFLSRTEIDKYLVWSANVGGQAALRQMGVRVDFNLRNGPFIDTLKERGSWLLDSMDDTTLSALQDKMVSAVKDGLTATEIQSSITAEFEDDINPYRAEMITRTEFANAAVKASRKTYEESGIRDWTWSQAPGDEDDDCTDNDGETVKMGEAFPSGDEEPPVHPNCKCSVTPAIPEDWDMAGAWLGD